MKSNITATLSGPLFTKNLTKVVENAIIDETIEKLGVRMERGGKGLGVRSNRITRKRNGLTMDVMSTRIFPRTRGTAWTRKNMAIAKSMGRNVLRKTAQRICGELGR